jgi:hypothetical protein
MIAKTFVKCWQMVKKWGVCAAHFKCYKMSVCLANAFVIRLQHLSVRSCCSGPNLSKPKAPETRLQNWHKKIVYDHSTEVTQLRQQPRSEAFRTAVMI